ncbi:hypothetical protein PIB30_082112 [Stylosanthes scabra]|uniref:Uncharacterized protein n=1 Tax=Stylosanthes scabra TaxID=79078 RepID=A0ABU6TRF2_9FABA|nr:hypothetical protein [Stylosanthes scabra]
MPKFYTRKRDPVEDLIEGEKLKKTFWVTCNKCREKGHNFKACKGVPANPNWKPNTRKNRRGALSSGVAVEIQISKSASPLEAFKMRRKIFNDNIVVGSTPNSSSTPSSITPTSIQDGGIGGTSQNPAPTATQQTVPVSNAETEAPRQTETAKPATAEPSKEIKCKPTRAPSIVWAHFSKSFENQATSNYCENSMYAIVLVMVPQTCINI